MCHTISVYETVAPQCSYFIPVMLLLSLAPTLLARSSLFYNTSARHERHECNTNDTSATRTTRVQHECGRSDTSATRVRQERHECNTSATRVLHQQHECDTSATGATRVRHEWENLILITTRVKTYFHVPVLTIWQMKDYKERNNFILRTTFRKRLVPMPKCIWKV